MDDKLGNEAEQEVQEAQKMRSTAQEVKRELRVFAYSDVDDQLGWLHQRYDDNRQYPIRGLDQRGWGRLMAISNSKREGDVVALLVSFYKLLNRISTSVDR